MIKIWAKCLVGDHIKKDMIYETLDHYNPETLFHHITAICNELDIPTPVILKNHVDNFDKFNHAIFLKRDFVESIDFDKLVLEHVITK
ncbi:MAG: hypothetical protein J5689_02460 [Clostridia bacterium]|nr:hypothetical protein [Clostridia bacterium]